MKTLKSSPQTAAALAVALIIIVLIVLPTAIGAIGAMGTSQWLAALAMGLVFTPAAIGVFLTFRVLDFPDLTIDASFPAGGAIAATLIVNDVSAWWTMPASMILGALLGLITGALYVFLQINSLLASIITLTATFTINLRIQGSSNISLIGFDRIYTPLTDPIKNRMEASFGDKGIQIHRSIVTTIVAIMIVGIVIATLRWFFQTEIGLAMRATGSNVEMSRSQAINTSGYLIGGVALSNALTALTGAMFVQHEGFADVNSGRGLIVAGLASVIIGEVIFAGKSRSMLRLLLAAMGGMIVYRFAIALALNTEIRFVLFDIEPIPLQAGDIKLATASVVALMLAIPRLQAIRADKARRAVS